MKYRNKTLKSGIKLVVIGASLGGLQALQKIFSKLPENYPLSVATALHRGKDGDDEMLVHLLQKFSPVPVVEVEDKTPVAPGAIYIAPADYHLLVDKDHFVLSLEAPVHHARPSIDVLFESAASAFKDQLVGVLLTGASSDGASGLALIKSLGGFTVVQDPETAEADSMPLAAVRKCKVDRIMPLEDIAEFLSQLAAQKDQRRKTTAREKNAGWFSPGEKEL